MKTLAKQILRSSVSPFAATFSSTRCLMLAAGLLMMSSVGMFANNANLNFTTPTNKAKTTVTVKIETTSIPVDIPPGTSAPDKRDLIRVAINSNKVPSFIARDNGDTGISIKYLTAGTPVEFDPGSTGEAKDQVVAYGTTNAWFGFGTADYASTDAAGNPSTFTGGIVTDFGELSFTVSATDLPALDGTTITQALFADLEPLASSFGASILNKGSELQFTFNSLDTEPEGGVVFGTTALTDGAFGGLVIASTPEPSSLLLLGSGILGFGGFLRKRLLTRS